jgi:hypothetical protein
MPTKKMTKALITGASSGLCFQLSALLLNLLSLPPNMEISEIIINRKVIINK